MTAKSVKQLKQLLTSYLNEAKTKPAPAKTEKDRVKKPVGFHEGAWDGW